MDFPSMRGGFVTFQQFDEFFGDFGWGMFGFLIFAVVLVCWAMFGDSIPLTVFGMIGGATASFGVMLGLARRSDRNWVARAVSGRVQRKVRDEDNLGI